MKRILIVLSFALGCGDDHGDHSHPDAPGSADAFESICGQPGDMGNSIGVGKFCEALSDCNGNGEATVCSSLGDENTHFCTKLCDGDAGPTVCGENATCVCASLGCGCTPTECLN